MATRPVSKWYRPGDPSRLRQLGVISYARGLITVLDRWKLETPSCECYEVVRKETEFLLDYMPQRQTIKTTESIPLVTLETPPVPESRKVA